MATKEAKLQIVVDAQNRTQGTFNALQNNLDAVKKSYNGLQNALTVVGSAGAASAASLGLLTKGVIKAGADFEQTRIAFETMLGSADQAQKTLSELSQFAAKTPFELTQLEEASKRLLAYGTAADDLIPTLRMLGDISAGVGMDKLPQLILAFGQVRAATKLTGMELRQFSEAGVPLLGTLAAQLGRTEAEIMEMVAEGKIGFTEVKTALQSLTGEGSRFHNLMATQATSLGGLWSNLKDQISLTSRTVGTELLPHLKPVVDRLIEMTKAVGAFAAEHPKLTAALLIGALAFSLLLALLLPIAIALPGLILLFSGLATVFAVVTAISAPMLLAIGAIVTVLALLAIQGYLTKEAWQDVWLGIKLIAAESANAVINIVEGMINFVIEGVNKAIRAINKVIAAAQKVPGIGKSISKIGELTPMDLGGFDTNLIAANDLASRSTPQKAAPTVNLFGNFLSEDAAEQIGDLIMKKLKLSNQL